MLEIRECEKKKERKKYGKNVEFLRGVYASVKKRNENVRSYTVSSSSEMRGEASV